MLINDGYIYFWSRRHKDEYCLIRIEGGSAKPRRNLFLNEFEQLAPLYSGSTIARGYARDETVSRLDQYLSPRRVSSCSNLSRKSVFFLRCLSPLYHEKQVIIPSAVKPALCGVGPLKNISVRPTQEAISPSRGLAFKTPCMQFPMHRNKFGVSPAF